MNKLVCYRGHHWLRNIHPLHSFFLASSHWYTGVQTGARLCGCLFHRAKGCRTPGFGIWALLPMPYQQQQAPLMSPAVPYVWPYVSLEADTSARWRAPGQTAAVSWCRVSSAGSSSACSGSRVGRVFVLNPCGTSMTSMVPVCAFLRRRVGEVQPSTFFSSVARTLRFPWFCPWWRVENESRVRCSTKRACVGASSTQWRLRQVPTAVFGVGLCVLVIQYVLF